LGAGLVGLVVVAGVLPVVSAVPCAAASPPYIAPVDGPVVRGFDPPLGPYAAGHRGVDFGVPAGTEVEASAGGEVTFAGPVAGDGLFVTIQHAGGISTTYSFLSEVRVAVGQRVKQGEVIALSGDGHPGSGVPALHFGAKLGDAYIDPELLLFGNLKDISDAIALAPLSGLAGSDIGPVEPNGPFLHPPAQFRPRDEAALHGFEAAGSKIAGAGRKIWAVPVSAWHWISSRAASAGHLLQSISAAGGRAAQLLGSSNRTTGFIGRSAALARRTVALAKRGSQWVTRHFQRLSHLLGRAGSWFTFLDRFRLASSFIAHIKSTINSMKDAGLFALGMIKGVGGQIRCTIKGGATPPPIPAALGQGPPPKAPNGNIVVAVAGIGSHTDRQKNGKITSNADMYSMDLRTLGFKEDQIFHFSYKGIESGGRGPYRLHAPYSKEDTYKSIVDSAALLDEQLRAIHRLYPDKKIDIVAHSQGGLVAEYYVTKFFKKADKDAAVIDHMVTIASPHQGTDAATLYRSLSRSSLGQGLVHGLDWAADGTGLLPRPSAASVQQMAEGSGFIKRLNKNWDPKKVRTTTIGATFDFVVPAPHTLLKGSAHYTTNLSNFSFSSLNAHSASVSATSTKGIVYNALRDTPSACTSLRDAVANFGTGRVIANVEQELTQGIGDVAAVAGVFIGNKKI
jgi:hypothetical protein